MEIDLDRGTLRRIRTQGGGVQKKTLERLCDGLGWDLEIDLEEDIDYVKYVKQTPDLPIGQELILGGYEITQLLDSTENYDTYLGIDRLRPHQHQCVIKRLKNQRGERGKELFEREATILDLLGEHDQIPGLLARSPQPDENGYFYLVHEFIEGTNLSQEIIVGKPWIEERVITLLQEILEILNYVHREGVIHRDINPQNLIRRSSDRKLVLINFGSVKQVSTEIETISIAGTLRYMAPEQEFGIPRLASDIYAVGILGIQSITGVKPEKFKADPQTWEYIWRDKARVSPKFAEILDQMVQFDCQRRYQSAAEALETLQAIQ